MMKRLVYGFTYMNHSFAMGMYRHSIRCAMLICATYSANLFAQTPCLSSEQIAKVTVVQSTYQAGTLKPALLSHSLSALMRADQKCAQKHGVCQLDFDPLYDSQDPEIERIEYRCQKNQVIATLFAPNDKPKPIAFAFIRENGVWKIDDLYYTQQRHLKQILSHPN